WPARGTRVAMANFLPGVGTSTCPRGGSGGETALARGSKARHRNCHTDGRFLHLRSYSWETRSMILAGDIGGTKTVLAHFEESGGGLRRLHSATYHSGDYRSLEAILAAYLKDNPGKAPRAGCFGVPGTVLDGKCHTTNLPWQLDDRALARAIGAAQAKLLNDLEATGYGILQLPANELCVLNRGSRPGRRGHAAVIAAGTGLGEAILYWDGRRH